MDEYQREELVQQVEGMGKRRRRAVLRDLGVPRSTYYQWRKGYGKKGVAGLQKSRTGPRRFWNRLTGEERERMLTLARGHPELSPRLLAVKITDEEDFSVSESTVYRLLKQVGLIAPRPLPELPAAREWRHKTKSPDELWQCDATNLFVVGWGYYKLIPVEDDYSRKIIAWDLRPDETAFSLADVVELALEEARREGHLLTQPAPQLYTDNGPGFASKLMAGYLAAHGIRHIFGTPYHPQGRGKIERFNRTIKEKLCLVVYCAPEELRQAIGEAVRAYNGTPHEALDNVAPNDVYAGKREVILEQRKEKKRLTLRRRKEYNLGRPGSQNDPPKQGQTVSSEKDNVSRKI